MIDWSDDDSSHDNGATREAKQKSDASVKQTERYQDAKLDFSPQSLTALDEIIWTLFGGRYLCKTKLEALVCGFGGYVAEVIQRNNEGFWKKAKNRYTFEFTRDE